MEGSIYRERWAPDFGWLVFVYKQACFWAVVSHGFQAAIFDRLPPKLTTYGFWKCQACGSAPWSQPLCHHILLASGFSFQPKIGKGKKGSANNMEHLLFPRRDVQSFMWTWNSLHCLSLAVIRRHWSQVYLDNLFTSPVFQFLICRMRFSWASVWLTWQGGYKLPLVLPLY